MHKSMHGFTLIEMVIVIVVTGIIAAGVAVFIRTPVKGYVDSVSRAELTDEADTAVRRMSRDLRLALPNSIRVSGDGAAIEFLLTRTGGRYLDEEDGVGGDILDFSDVNDTNFRVVGSLATSGPQQIVVGDQVVVYNLGIPPADAYNCTANSCNRATVTAVDTDTTPTITFASTTNPFAEQAPVRMRSPSHRFQIVNGPVMYVCTGGNLTRYSGYTIASAMSVPPPGSISGRLASNVTDCQFGYGTLANVRSALVSIRLSLVRGDSGTVSLFHQLHVDNTP